MMTRKDFQAVADAIVRADKHLRIQYADTYPSWLGARLNFIMYKYVD